MLVQLSVEELRAIAAEVVDHKPKLLWLRRPSGNGVLVRHRNQPKQYNDAKHSHYGHGEIEILHKIPRVSPLHVCKGNR